MVPLFLVAAAVMAVAPAHATASKAPLKKKAKAVVTKTVPAPKPEVKADTTAAKPAPPRDETDYTIPAGQEGTVFKSLTVEGEDRVHLEFERPELVPDVDPHTAPGLDPAGAGDVLMRNGPDLMKPFATMSSLDRLAWVARPCACTSPTIRRWRRDVRLAGFRRSSGRSASRRGRRISRHSKRRTACRSVPPNSIRFSR